MGEAIRVRRDWKSDNMAWAKLKKIGIMEINVSYTAVFASTLSFAFNLHSIKLLVSRQAKGNPITQNLKLFALVIRPETLNTAIHKIACAGTDISRKFQHLSQLTWPPIIIIRGNTIYMEKLRAYIANFFTWTK